MNGGKRAIHVPRCCIQFRTRPVLHQVPKERSVHRLPCRPWFCEMTEIGTSLENLGHGHAIPNEKNDGRLFANHLPALAINAQENGLGIAVEIDLHT